MLKCDFNKVTITLRHGCSVNLACNFIKKETLAQVFSGEFCEISNDIFSYRTPLVAASKFSTEVAL